MKTDNIKLGKHLNEEIWKCGIRNPPRRVRVHIAVVDNECRAELMGHEYTEFKAKPAEKKQGMAEKLAARMGGKAIQKQEEEKAIEGKEKTDEDKNKPQTV